MSTEPLVACCGVGRDSVAVLVGLKNRGIRPDLVMFADVGAERKKTYAYIPILNAWLAQVGFPTLTIVKYVPSNFKHWPEYGSLFENLLTNSTLPSIAYGRHSCSSKWKIAPQNKYLETWEPAVAAWKTGLKVRKMIGFDASPHEQRRKLRCSTYAVQDEELDRYTLEFPLQDWGWDLDECKRQILAEGLPLPSKSSCFFCTAMKPWEVDELAVDEPDALKNIVVIEARASQRNLDYAKGRHAKLKDQALRDDFEDDDERQKVVDALHKMSGKPEGSLIETWQWDGKPLTEGLWRKAVLGKRKGSVAKPGSITEYIRNKGLLPSDEIDRIIRVTPTAPLKKGDITSWEDFLQKILTA